MNVNFWTGNSKQQKKTFWNNSGNDDATMDLGSIDNFAIYLGEGGIDSGSFLIDDIRLIR